MAPTQPGLSDIGHRSLVIRNWSLAIDHWPSAFRHFACAALSVLIGAGAAGCGNRETPVQEGLRTKTLLLGNSAEPADLDPQILSAYTEMNITIALFEGLTAIDEATSQPVPGAAASWDISDDGLVYTFHLRPEGRWSNGDPVTAQDFAWSFRRILTPALGAEYSYMLWPIRNAEAFNEGQITDFSQVGVKALDDLTLELTLDAPCPWLLALAAHQAWFPVNPATVEAFGGATTRGTNWTRPGNLVGNGAFMLEEWTPNSRIVVVRNHEYWDDAHNGLERVIFYPIENFNTEENSFRAGQLHITYGLAPDRIPTYREEAPELLRVDPFLETHFLSLNTARPPLDDVRVRRALSLAIDRSAIANGALLGSVTPAAAFTPPDTAGYTSSAALQEDPEEARALLAAAGYPGGRGFPALELQVKADNLHRINAEAIQQMWRTELGITVTLVPLEQKTWLQNLQAKNFTLSTTRWIGDYVDANTFLDMWLTNGGNNWTGWGDPAYDALVTEAGGTLDADRRHDLQRQAEAILLDNLPIIPVFHGTRVYLADPMVKGWVPNLLGIHRYQYLRLESEAQ